MIRLRNLIWLVLVAMLGFGTYTVKYRVQSLDEELARTDRQIRDDEDALHVLRAEWSYLNQPARLDELTQRHLQLVPIATRQLGQLAAIPMKLSPEHLGLPAPAVFQAAPADMAAGTVVRPEPRPQFLARAMQPAVHVASVRANSGRMGGE